MAATTKASGSSSSSSLSSSLLSSLLSLVLTVVVTVVMVVMVVGVGVRVVSGEQVLGERTDDFDFDGLPGVQHEFKVEIHARSQDCFFQKVAKGASVHVSFEVLRGGDRIVNLVVRNAHGQIVRVEEGKNTGAVDFESPFEETYAICLDNFGSFSAKLVFVYIVAFAMEDWSAYAKEIDDLFFFADNATMTLANVEHSVQTMLTSQSQFRLHAMRDMYLAWSNLSYVNTWSLVQCVVIIATSVVQVIFVRRLFRTTAVTPTAKPRA